MYRSSIGTVGQTGIVDNFRYRQQHRVGIHKNIQHTVRYSELALDRFKNFWR
jgi:hypothetical protein